RSRRSLTDAGQRVRELAARLPEAEVELEVGSEPLAPGDAVEAPHLGVRGRLASLAGATATVQSGTVTVRVPAQALRKMGALATPPRPTRLAAPSRLERASVAPELHLLGRRADEARSLVEKYLDDAFLAGLPTVRLVHGKGTGALRKTIHELLTGHPLVQSFRTGEPAEGGSGATVADLKVS
ncbi:MAG TPA: Smr/MutS family protein, partial [Solirubrobacteraceae bacterium]